MYKINLDSGDQDESGEGVIFEKQDGLIFQKKIKTDGNRSKDRQNMLDSMGNPAGYLMAGFDNHHATDEICQMVPKHVHQAISHKGGIFQKKKH